MDHGFLMPVLIMPEKFRGFTEFCGQACVRWGYPQFFGELSTFGLFSTGTIGLDARILGTRGLGHFGLVAEHTLLESRIMHGENAHGE
jgi:hypothetical protein